MFISSFFRMKTPNMDFKIHAQRETKTITWNVLFDFASMQNGKQCDLSWQHLEPNTLNNLHAEFSFVFPLTWLIISNIIWQNFWKIAKYSLAKIIELLRPKTKQKIKWNQVKHIFIVVSINSAIFSKCSYTDFTVDSFACDCLVEIFNLC